MQLAFAEPCLPLRPFIGGYYLVSSDVPYLQDVARADIGQLRLFLDGSGRLAPGHDTAPLVTPRALSGPSTYASEFALIGPVRMFGIALLPAAWGMIVPVSAARLRNQICDGQDLFGTALETFRDQLINCQTLPEMATFADRFLAAQLAPARSPQPQICAAIRRWLCTKLAPDPQKLFADLSLSPRQIERIANHYWGVPPRTLSRQYAALRTAHGLAAKGAPPAASLAHYADAAHLIREVRRVTGQTPKQLRATGNQLMRTSLILPSFPELQDRG